jgi:hypothetical protein
VKEDDTIASLLEREGDRELLDPATTDVLTLRELFAAAGVDPATRIRTRSDALATLEGRAIDVAGLRAVRESVDSLLRAEGRRRLEADEAGVPAGALNLPATSLRSATHDAVKEAIGDVTVGEVAELDRKAFVDRIARKAPREGKQRAREEAAKVWTDATRLSRLAEAWRPGEPAAEAGEPEPEEPESPTPKPRRRK